METRHEDIEPAIDHPAVHLLADRHHSSSRRGDRDDERKLALVVEGGGMRGAISAGMCVALEKSGLIDAVDIIYGVSSGALNGSYTAAGQAEEGSANYIDTANLRFANPLHPIVGRDIVDFSFLFEEVMKKRRPYSEGGLAVGPEFRTVAVDLETKKPTVLKDFKDVAEMTDAVRASCSMPLATRPALYRGRPYADGGIVVPLAHEIAFEEGATDVVVLRSQPAKYRKAPEPAVVRWMIQRGDPGLGTLIEGMPERYNRMAEDLQAQTAEGGRAFQVSLPAGLLRIARVEYSERKIREGLLLGAAALRQALDSLGAAAAR